MRLRHPLTVFFGVAALTVLLDQVTKAMARQAFTPGETHRFIPGVLDLTLTGNTGAAFGILSGQRPVFVAVTALVLVVVAIFLWRQRPTAPLVVIALGLLAGGGIGNLIDRVGRGWVTDFFEFGFVEFPVFNVADAAIFVGVGMLIVWLLISPPHPQPGEAGAETSSQSHHEGGAPTDQSS